MNDTSKNEQTALSVSTQAPVEQSAVPGDLGASALMGAIISAGSTPGVNVENIERLASLYERLEAKKAEQAFNAAMRDVQAELPRIVKDAENKDNHSRYARLETIGKVIKPVISKHGFSQSFGTDASPLPEHYRVTCTLSHTAGHSREYFADIPRDMTGIKGAANKTPTHGFGSSMSYGRRYLTMLIFNLELANEDDDGNAAGRGPCIDESQAIQLTDLAAKAYPNPDGTAYLIARICKKFNIENTTQMKVKDFPDACRLLNDTIASVRDKERAAAAKTGETK